MYNQLDRMGFNDKERGVDMRYRGAGFGLKKLIGLIIVIGLIIALVILGIRLFKKSDGPSSRTYAMIGEDISKKVDNFVDEVIVGHEGEIEEETYINFEDIVDFSRLTSSRFRYENFFSREINGRTVYYTSYSANVEFGIDMNRIEVSTDHDKKIIEIVLPSLSVIL